MRRLSPGQVRNAIKHQLESEEGVEGFHRGISVDAVLVMIRMGLGPGMRPVALRDLRGEAPAAIVSEPPPPPCESEKAKTSSRDEVRDGPGPTRPALETCASSRARAACERPKAGGRDRSRSQGRRDSRDRGCGRAHAARAVVVAG